MDIKKREHSKLKRWNGSGEITPNQKLNTRHIRVDKVFDRKVNNNYTKW